MTAEQRDHRRAVRRHREHRRLPPLVGDQGRQRPHQHPRRADADDRAPGGEQRAQGLGGGGVMVSGGEMLALGERGDPLAEGVGAGEQGEDGGGYGGRHGS